MTANVISSTDHLNLNDRKNKYDIAIIHAEDDYDIPWEHSDDLFEQAMNATREFEATLSFGSLEMAKDRDRVWLGAGGWEVEWTGRGGIIREQIVKHGLHDRIMSYPVVSLAVARALHSRESD